MLVGVDLDLNLLRKTSRVACINVASERCGWVVARERVEQQRLRNGSSSLGSRNDSLRRWIAWVSKSFGQTVVVLNDDGIGFLDGINDGSLVCESLEMQKSVGNAVNVDQQLDRGLCNLVNRESCAPSLEVINQHLRHRINRSVQGCSRLHSTACHGSGGL